MQTRSYDIGSSDEKKECRVCEREEGTDKHRLFHCPSWRDVTNQIPERLRKWEQRPTTPKEDWTWQRGIAAHHLSADQWKKSQLTVRRWEYENVNIACSHLCHSRSFLLCLFVAFSLDHDVAFSRVIQNRSFVGSLRLVECNANAWNVRYGYSAPSRGQG